MNRMKLFVSLTVRDPHKERDVPRISFALIKYSKNGRVDHGRLQQGKGISRQATNGLGELGCIDPHNQDCRQIDRLSNMFASGLTIFSWSLFCSRSQPVQPTIIIFLDFFFRLILPRMITGKLPSSEVQVDSFQ